MSDALTCNAVLIDTTKCMGCRGCQVACKQWNEQKAESTAFFGGPGYQNPPALSADTFTLVKYHEVETSEGLKWVFTKHGCMHCEEPACVSACPVGALNRQASGAVTYDASKCIGCRYCMLACPWQIPKYQWTALAPYVRKCTGCDERVAHGKKPACVSTCPTGALQYGPRDAMLAEARKRIADNPKQYVNHIYGEKEAGGTGVFYMAAVPFASLGFPMVGEEVRSVHADRVLHVLPWWVMGLGASLSALYWFNARKKKLAEEKKNNSAPMEKR